MAQAPAGYYDEADVSTDLALRASLHAIIDDHTRIPYTSSSLDTWDVLEMADQDQDQPGNITTLYRNNSLAKQGRGNDAYNREHTWPRSYGFTDDEPTNYPFSDMHALFLADIDYNAERQNQPYGDCEANCRDFPAESNDGRGGSATDINQTIGEFSQGSWEVWPARRGDIARAMFYMDVRYEGGQHGATAATEPDLILTDDRDLIEAGRSDRNETVAHMGLLTTLLDWHRQDPVDAVEQQHHEAVFGAQGNRNPFIDQPNYVDCVYRNDCSRLQAPQFEPGALAGLWYDPAANGEGYNVIVSNAGITVFFYGYSNAGERLWLLSSTIPADFAFGQTLNFDVFDGRDGTFDSVATAALDTWGSLSLIFNDCSNATFELTGVDGTKVSNAVVLARIAGLACD